MSASARIIRATAALAAAIAAFMVLGTLAASAASRPHTPKLRSGHMHDHPDILVMVWKGIIGKGMSEQVRAAFDKAKDKTTAVVLRIDSPGGSVAEGERVIAVLQDIKRTHKLITSVAAGKRCGSMCVFIYVQGQKRLAAPASLWLFHEVSHMDHAHRSVVSLDRDRWLALVDKYWVPAGVSQAWIDKVKAHAVETDVWESGSDLLREGANLIQRPLSDEKHRIVRPVSDSK